MYILLKPLGFRMESENLLLKAFPHCGKIDTAKQLSPFSQQTCRGLIGISSSHVINRTLGV